MATPEKKKKEGMNTLPYIRIGKEGCCSVSTRFYYEVNKGRAKPFGFILFKLDKETGKFKFKFDAIGKKTVRLNGFYLKQQSTLLIIEKADLPDIQPWTSSLYFTFESIGGGWYQSKEPSLTRPK